MKIIKGAEDSFCVTHGSSWRSYVDYSRMAYRDSCSPVNRPDRSGFRIVRSNNENNNKRS